MPQTDKALAELAQKLGVTVQYLWDAMLRQQHIEGLFLIGCIVLLTALAIGIPLAYNAITDLANPTAGAITDLHHLLR